VAAEHGQGFVEIAERCFVARYAAWDTTIGAVIGADGILVVDTRATHAHGVEIRDHLRAIAPDLPVRWVVNTHEHFDHVLGNAVFGQARIHAQANAAAQIDDAVERIRERIRADPTTDPDYPDITADVLQGVLDAPVRLPDETFHSVATIDLGGRYVELVHPGRGHTDGDLVVRVPDADVVYAGDLVEESAPPSFGSDSFPLEWPATLDIIVGMLTPSSVLSPGHGAVVDRDFVMGQREEVSTVAEAIRSLYVQGVPLEQALDAGAASWPYPSGHLGSAVERGYQQLAAAGVAAGSVPPRPLLDLPDLPLA
jgi:glyoxylase-like metal-dependent hydrolase (beta-lactamase superfamily II)